MRKCMFCDKENRTLVWIKIGKRHICGECLNELSEVLKLSICGD